MLELNKALQLALLVLAEARKGPGSPYAEYIKTLPGFIDVPALWKDEELQQLKCQYFIEQSECELDAWAGEFRVVASQPWQAGEQVFINYSSSSNDALLQLYGFIDPGNMQDRFVVKTLPTSLKLAGLNQQQNAPQVLSQVINWVHMAELHVVPI
eukprot:gene13494-13620_t